MDAMSPPPPPHGRPWSFINYAPPLELEPTTGNRAERRKAAAKARGKGKRHAH